MNLGILFEKLFHPLASRKVRIALATILAAYAAECGLKVTEDMMLPIVSVGVALILGIAHEDNGRLRSDNTVADQ